MDGNYAKQDVEKFIDAKFWGQFFPEFAKKTLDKFGIAYDESRSFIFESIFIGNSFNILTCRLI